MKQKELWIIAVVLVVVGVMIACLPFALGGQTVTTGETFGVVEQTDAVSCVASGVAYPYLESKLDEVARKVQVDMKFEEGEMDVVGLKYETEYASEERAREAFQMLAPELNLVMEQNGASKIMVSGAKMTRNGRNVVLNLFLPREELTEANAKFLMMVGNEALSAKKEVLVENYEKQGLKCD